jgi:hypothetical protein
VKYKFTRMRQIIIIVFSFCTFIGHPPYSTPLPAVPNSSIQQEDVYTIGVQVIKFLIAKAKDITHTIYPTLQQYHKTGQQFIMKILICNCIAFIDG